jgi:hypothetical protein
VLIGGVGTDLLSGAEGGDRFFVRDAWRDRLQGGPGYDHATLDRHDTSRDVERRDRSTG